MSSESFNQTYLHPLLIPKNKKTLKIKERDIRVLFRNIEELHKRHCVFMFQLHSHMMKFPANERTGSLLVKEVVHRCERSDRGCFVA